MEPGRNTSRHSVNLKGREAHRTLTVDWPGAHVWRELAEAFPEAKLIHTVRPEEVWWNSFAKIIAELMTTYKQLPLPPHIDDILDAWGQVAGQATFAGNFADRDTAYRRPNEELQAAIPADRLLVLDVAEGWQPLCRFLDIPAPANPFPHRNLRADFWEVLGNA